MYVTKCLVGTSIYYFTITPHLTSLKANKTALSMYYYLSCGCGKTPDKSNQMKGLF